MASNVLYAILIQICGCLHIDPKGEGVEYSHLPPAFGSTGGYVLTRFKPLSQVASRCLSQPHVKLHTLQILGICSARGPE